MLPKTVISSYKWGHDLLLPLVFLKVVPKKLASEDFSLQQTNYYFFGLSSVQFIKFIKLFLAALFSLKYCLINHPDSTFSW